MVVATVFQWFPCLKIINNENVTSTLYIFQFVEMWIGGFGTTCLSFRNQPDIDMYSSMETVVWIAGPPFRIIPYTTSNSAMFPGCQF
jgi:hypothetical protein